MNFTLCQDRNEAILATKAIRGTNTSPMLPPLQGETLEQNDARSIDFLLDKGQILIGKEGENFVGFCGYLCQEPSTAYVYIAAISQAQRGSRVFLKGLSALAEELGRKNIQTVRFKARVGNDYNNRLYSKFATPVREEPNETGDLCVLYEVTLDSLSKKLSRYKIK